MRKCLSGALFIAILFFSCNLFAQIVSNFNTNNEGWTITDINNLNPQTVNYNAAGGNPGGDVSVTYGTNQPSFWIAPAKFLGSHCLSSYGMNLKFDLEFSSNTGLVHSNVVGDVVLYNNTSAIAINLPSFPATGSWTSYSIKLDATGGWHNGSVGGALSTESDITNILTNLTKIMINGQYKFATGTISNLDNVILETTPLGTPPTITSFSPASGLPNTTSVTLTGSNFNPVASSNIVYFGGVKATVTSASTTQLIVSTPPGAQYAPITVADLSTGLEASTIVPFLPLFNNNKDFGGQIIRATLAPFVTFDLENTTGLSEAGDIDGDGLNDIVVAETGLKKFSVLRNAGVTGVINTTSFAPKVSFFMKDPGKGYVAMADFDGDGKLDVAISEADAFTAYIAVFRNTSTPGSISFDTPLYYLGQSYSDGPLTAGDMDGDGRPEIVGVFNNNCGSSNRVYILPNRSKPGAIDFCTNLSFGPVYTCGGFITIGDLDGDKLPDVLVTSGSGTSIATVMKNTSTPGVLSMATPFVLTSTNLEGRAVIADLDNDGKNDIGWPYYSTSVEVRKNLYSGGVLDATSFSAGIIFTGTVGFTSSTSELIAADINSDGKVDLVANGQQNMSIWQNVSTTGVLNTSSFLPGIPYVTSTSSYTPASPRVADFDGDNKPDIFMKISNASPPAEIIVFHNESFPVPRVDNFSPSSGTTGSTVTLTGDYLSTGTGLPVVSGRLGPLATSVVSSSNTSASAIVPPNSFSNRFSVTEHGLTGFSNHFNVLNSTSKIIDVSSFPTSINFTISGAPRDALEIADFDDDGKVDVIVGDANTKIFQNTHATAGQPITTSSLTLQSTTYAIGYNIVAFDIDGDGKVDLNNGYGLIKNSSTVGSISFLYGPTGSYTYASAFTGVTTGDFNKDGKTDIAMTNGSASVQVFENRSTKDPFTNNSNFSTINITPVTLTKPGTNGVIITADLDGDGYDDLAATTNATNNFTFYRNQAAYGPLAAASFSAGTNVTTGTTPYGLTASDFDGDGKIDIAVTHFNALFVSVYLNTSTPGTISFAAPANFTTVNKGYNITSQDLDGDGKAEIVVIHQPNPGPGSFTVMQNKSSVGTASFSAVNYPMNRNPQQLNIADINADQKPDILIVANSGTLGHALMVYENKIASGPVITVNTQPGDAAVCAGATASFTTSASGATNITYQWQFATSSVATFNDITNGGGYTGVTSNTLSVNTTGNFGTGRYRCKVSGDLATTVFTIDAGLVINAIPAAPTTTGSSNCNATSFTLHASGGTNGQYRWYNDQTGPAISGEVNNAYTTSVITATTTYYVSLNNGTCESSRMAVIAILAPLGKPALSFSPAVTSNNINLCTGQTETLTAPSGFETYVWSNGEGTSTIVITQPGTYSVVLTDVSGCMSPSSDPVTVAINPYPSVSITANETSLTASAGDSYQWYSDGTLVQGATDQTFEIPVLEYGVYAVDVTTKGCTTHSADFVYLVTGTENPISALRVYPNPVGDELSIETSTGINDLKIFDLLGKELNLPIVEGSSGKIISTKDLRSGQYILVLQTTQSKTYYKILKQ